MTTRSFGEIHVTGEGLRTLGVYRHFFKCALQRIRQAEADYEAEVKAWYEENPGYQFPRCIHGSSLTTDYDNICGDCEDGSTAIELAIVEGRTRFLTFVGFFDWMSDAPAALPEEIRKQIVEFSVTLLPKPIGG